MITLTRVKQATDAFIKVLRFGKSDVQTSDQATPFGIDSKPISNVLAVHSTTSSTNESIIVGYIMKVQGKTTAGETYIYSMDSSGTIKSNIYLRDDGKIAINGDTDNAVRYSSLNTGISNMAIDINTELAKIVACFSALGQTYTLVPIVPDISAAKIDDILTD
jgi:hypothetical protein